MLSLAVGLAVLALVGAAELCLRLSDSSREWRALDTVHDELRQEDR